MDKKRKSYLNDNVEKWLKNYNSLMIKPVDYNKKRIRQSFIPKRLYLIEDDLENEKINEMLKIMNDDNDYKNYRSLTEKKQKVNKLNFVSNQIKINISPTKNKNKIKNKNIKLKNLSQKKISYSSFIKFQNLFKKKKKEIIEFEKDFSSSDSYDSDFININDENIEKKINKIKKNEYLNESEIKYDLKKIILLLEKINLEKNC